MTIFLRQFLILCLLCASAYSQAQGFLSKEQRALMISPTYDHPVIPKRCQFLFKKHQWVTASTKGWDQDNLTSKIFDRDVVNSTDVGLWDKNRSARVYKLENIEKDFSKAIKDINHIVTGKRYSPQNLDSQILSCGFEKQVSPLWFLPSIHLSNESKCAQDPVFKGACIRQSAPYLYVDIIDRLDGQYAECSRIVRSMNYQSFNWNSFKFENFFKQCDFDIKQGLSYAENFRQQIQTIYDYLLPEAKEILNRALLIQSKFNSVDEMVQKGKELHAKNEVLKKSFDYLQSCEASDDQINTTSLTQEQKKKLGILNSNFEQNEMEQTLVKINQNALNNAMTLLWTLAQASGELSTESSKEKSINKACEGHQLCQEDSSFKEALGNAFDQYKSLLNGSIPINFKNTLYTEGLSFFDHFNRSIEQVNKECKNFRLRTQIKYQEYTKTRALEIQKTEKQLEEYRNSPFYTPAVSTHIEQQPRLEPTYQDFLATPDEQMLEVISKLEANPVYNLSKLASFRKDVGLGEELSYSSPLSSCIEDKNLNKITDLKKYFLDYKSKIDHFLNTTYENFVLAKKTNPNKKFRFLKIAKPDTIGIVSYALGGYGLVKLTKRNILLNSHDLEIAALKKYIQAFPQAINQAINQEIEMTGEAPWELLKVLCAIKADIASQKKIDTTFDLVIASGLSVCSFVGGVVTGGPGAVPCGVALGTYNIARTQERIQEQNQFQSLISESFHTGNFTQLEEFLALSKSILEDKNELKKDLKINIVYTALSFLPLSQVSSVGEIIKGSQVLSTIRNLVPIISLGYVYSLDPSRSNLIPLLVTGITGTHSILKDFPLFEQHLLQISQAFSIRSSQFFNQTSLNSKQLFVKKNVMNKYTLKLVLQTMGNIESWNQEMIEEPFGIFEELTRLNDFNNRLSAFYLNSKFDQSVDEVLSQLTEKSLESLDFLHSFIAHFQTPESLTFENIESFLNTYPEE